MLLRCSLEWDAGTATHPHFLGAYLLLVPLGNSTQYLSLVQQNLLKYIGKTPENITYDKVENLLPHLLGRIYELLYQM